LNGLVRSAENVLPEIHSVNSSLDYDVVIVGAGPAGMTAALYCGRSMLRTVVLDPAPGGELLNTEMIEDYTGFEHILGRDLAQKFESHARKFGAEFRPVMVTRIRKVEDDTFETTTDTGDVYRSPAVILTSGGTPVKLGVPGELEFAGKGVSYCAVCDGAFYRGHTIAVVGGGDAATEEADYLTRYADKVYLIHRRHELRASRLLRHRLMENPKVEIIWDTVVDEIHGDAVGLVDRLSLHNVVTGQRSELPVTGIFVFIGFRPNTGVIEGHVDHDAMGYLLTDTKMETSIPGLFAAGDVRVQVTRQITTAVGDGTTAAIAVDKYLTARGFRTSMMPVPVPAAPAS
jgi:thioredoxin reductase (NADPH)